jgi:alkanesulfonate monooxygenase SsuD/methylene tetrahydromethanopterin reductase-like flavin-dependent oxidoreductase (luciferase family)
MAQVGARVESPLTLLREHLTALRALLAGERVTTDGRYVHLDGVALDWPPDVAPRLLAGAAGPRSLALAGELADGTILTSDLSPAGVRTACGRVAEARSAAGRTDPHEVVVYVGAATGSGAAARLADDLQTFSAHPDGDVGVVGDAPELAAAVRRWAEAGAGTVVLQPTADEPDIEGFVQFAAQGVRPLLLDRPSTMYRV